MSKLHTVRTDNRSVARAFVHRHAAPTKSHNGNFSTASGILCSYHTPIAAWHGDHVFVTSYTYSKTTAGKHLSPLWSVLAAWPDRQSGLLSFNLKIRRDVFTVPNVDITQLDTAYARLQHSANVDHLVQKYKEALDWLVKVQDPQRIAGFANGYESYSLRNLIVPERKVGTFSSGGKKPPFTYEYDSRETEHVAHGCRGYLVELFDRANTYAKNWLPADYPVIPIGNYHHDIAQIMLKRRRREELYWHPARVKHRETQTAKKLLRNLVG